MKHFNRNARRQGGAGLFWCFGCDAFMVREGEKCPVCGKRNKIRRARPSERRQMDICEEKHYG